MKKILVAIISMIIFLFLSLFLFDEVVEAQTIETYFEITDYKYQKTESVFINELKNAGDKSYPSVKILNGFKSFWLVDGKRYRVQKNSYSVYDPTVNWQVDLSQVVPCGVCDEIIVYSSTGKGDNDILIAKENDETYLLVSDDSLYVEEYACEDFSVIDSKNRITNSLFKDIWSDHLSGEYDISNLLIEDASDVMHIKLQSEIHPELIYSFNYVEHKGNYYSKLPFDEDSNGYYDVTERVKEGKKVMKRMEANNQ